jgi:hypothetical protein
MSDLDELAGDLEASLAELSDAVAEKPKPKRSRRAATHQAKAKSSS